MLWELDLISYVHTASGTDNFTPFLFINQKTVPKDNSLAALTTVTNSS